jgi:hypothetical protein
MVRGRGVISSKRIVRPEKLSHTGERVLPWGSTAMILIDGDDAESFRTSAPTKSELAPQWDHRRDGAE